MGHTVSAPRRHRNCPEPGSASSGEISLVNGRPALSNRRRFRMSDERRATPNRLLIPFVAVSVICAAEAVIIAFLVGRGSPPATGVVQARADSAAPSAVPTAPSAGAKAIE